MYTHRRVRAVHREIVQVSRAFIFYISRFPKADALHRPTKQGLQGASNTCIQTRLHGVDDFVESTAMAVSRECQGLVQLLLQCTITVVKKKCTKNYTGENVKTASLFAAACREQSI